MIVRRRCGPVISQRRDEAPRSRCAAPAQPAQALRRCRRAAPGARPVTRRSPAELAHLDRAASAARGRRARSSRARRRDRQAQRARRPATARRPAGRASASAASTTAPGIPTRMRHISRGYSRHARRRAGSDPAIGPTAARVGQAGQVRIAGFGPPDSARTRCAPDRTVESMDLRRHTMTASATTSRAAHAIIGVSTSEMRTPERVMHDPHSEPVHVARARARADLPRGDPPRRCRAGDHPAAGHRQHRAAARRALRAVPVGRPRPASDGLRRDPPPRARADRAAPRPLRGRARARRRGARAAGARDLPRPAGAQRRARRDARAGPAERAPVGRRAPPAARRAGPDARRHARARQPRRGGARRWPTSA